MRTSHNYAPLVELRGLLGPKEEYLLDAAHLADEVVLAVKVELRARGGDAQPEDLGAGTVSEAGEGRAGQGRVAQVRV